MGKIKFGEISFWTDESNFDKVRDMLMNEFGLVPPKDDPFERTEKEKLVWVDREGIGQYRVDFKPDHPKGPLVYFRYWGDRLTPGVKEVDPMLEAAGRTYALIKPAERILGLFTVSEGHSKKAILKEITECSCGRMYANITPLEVWAGRIIRRYVSELNREGEGFTLEIRSAGLSWDYAACIQKVNVKEVEKRGLFGRKKVKECEPVMNIMYSGHRPGAHISYAPEWERKAECLERMIGVGQRVSKGRLS